MRKRSRSGRRSCRPSRITELGASDNFWQMGETGPCGRCSEIMYFRGNHVPCAEPVCQGLECSCERYVEVWNNVFMEFNRDEAGTLHPLPALSVDTGMGLERVTSVIQGWASNYDTDIFAPILDAIGRRAGRAYTPLRGRRRPPGRVDARHRGSPARDDVPHRRRRGAVERVARLRAAQDHAARDAPRQEARLHRARALHARRRP